MVLFVQRWALAAPFLFLFFLFCSTAQAAPGSGSTLELTVKVSSESAWAARLELTDSHLLQALEQPEQRSSAVEIPATDTYLTVTADGQTTTYAMDTQGYLYSESPMERLELKRKWSAMLLKHAAKMRAAHYGTIVEWEQAKQILPKFTKFKVTDMETGLSFHVQRRAGSSHADVQPLTKEDTAIMKQIYGGAWSWARRLDPSGERRAQARRFNARHAARGRRHPG
ncbi:hypothetical protein ACHHV8_05700 [Paenibacillus sp. TAB 01]|uniref:hypothetical protein n=1 Tax=Paenibacillus sp. TAB 01 TaxID=3368988 RepID=UPI0037508BEF